MSGVYRFLRGLLVPLTEIWTRLRKRGTENIPQQGAAVLVCNHLTLWDMVAAASLTRRRICFVAKSELEKVPVIRSVLKSVNAICVKRGTPDIGAIRKMLQALKEGELLLIFAEGTRNRHPESTPLLPLQEGAAMVALRARVPVIPIWISGKYNPFRGLRVRVGRTVDFGEMEDAKRPDLQSATECIERALLQVREEEIAG